MTTLNFAPALVERSDNPDGSFVLRSPVPLKPYPDTLVAHLERWADQTPQATFLAERGATGDWTRISFEDTRQAARAIAQSLLDRRMSADRPVMIVSDNSIDHALLTLGGYYAGVPVSPASPQYALLSKDFGKLRHVFGVLNPAMIYVPDGEIYGAALNSLDLNHTEIVVSRNQPADRPATQFRSLLDGEVTAGVDARHATLSGETVAKILFTSGSTGLPKGVLNTHKMLCSNQQALAQAWPFVEEKPPVLVDWLPWSHTFGANHNFNLVLRNGGTLFIDGGKPVPGLIDRTIANLRDIAPTLYFNVPRGYEQLMPFLRADEALRNHFFSRLDTVFYAAAALPQNLWSELKDMAIAARGKPIPMTSAWGSTETAPLATNVHFDIDKAGVIGLPVAGTDLKIVPNNDKLEIRVRGPNVTPGYFQRPDLTEDAFDEEGFYRMGDAVRLADPKDPARGLVFDGRVAEDFKLLTGSWVGVGTVRIAAISAAAPLIQDAVVTGHDRDEIGLLVFPNAAGLAALSGEPADTRLADLIARPSVRGALSRSLVQYNRDNPASSQRIGRALIMTVPPSLDANEITDKGYINQRAVLENRADLVERLYSDSEEVILVA